MRLELVERSETDSNLKLALATLHQLFQEVRFTAVRLVLDGEYAEVAPELKEAHEVLLLLIPVDKCVEVNLSKHARCPFESCYSTAASSSTRVRPPSILGTPRDSDTYTPISRPSTGGSSREPTASK